MEDAPVKILIIDDDKDDYVIIKSYLSKIEFASYSVDWEGTFTDGLERIKTDSHDIYLVDYRLNASQGTGLDLISLAIENGCDKPLVLLTGQEDRRIDVRAVKVGASDYLVKGELTPTILERSIRYSIERNATQIELRQAKEAAEKANQSKSQFLSDVSHEIRNPMNAILGLTELLKEEIEDPIQKDRLKSIGISGQLLLKIINDVLDFSKIEAGKLEIQKAYINFRSFIEESVMVFNPTARDKSLEYIVEVDDAIPVSVNLDETRTRQILLNLLSNAFKFTEKGFVKITARFKKDAEGNQLIISVHDSGIGIPKVEVDKVFLPFEQRRGQSQKEFGGTGLGLAISQKFARLMGGNIEVANGGDSGGSVFTLILNNVETREEIDPLTQVPAVINPKTVRFKPSTILIAEDVDINRDLIKAYLKLQGIDTVEAVNGLDCVEIARKIKPDLILMDIKMPVMDGFEATRKIKSDPELAHIPIIAVTAFAMKHEGEQINKLCDGYLRKPLSRGSLLNEIAKHISFTDSSTPVEKNNSTPPDEIWKKGSFDDSGLTKKNQSLYQTLKEQVLPKVTNPELLSVGDMTAIANEIGELARKYENQSLQQWAELLLRTIMSYNAHESEKRFTEFPQIIESLKSR